MSKSASKMGYSYIFDIIVFVLLVVVGIIQGHKGFFSQLGSITGYITGLLLSLVLSPLLIDFVESKLTVKIDPLLLSYFIFLFLYILIFLVMKWIGINCSNMAKGTKIENIDKTLGFILGALMTFVVLVMMLFMLNKGSGEEEGLAKTITSWYKNSFSYKHILGSCVELFGKIFSNISGKV